MFWLIFHIALREIIEKCDLFIHHIEYIKRKTKKKKNCEGSKGVIVIEKIVSILRKSGQNLKQKL